MRVGSAGTEGKRWVWLCGSGCGLTLVLQGLYEYVKPAWQKRPRPQIDEEKFTNFGKNVAPRPLNPSQKEMQVYPVTMEIEGSQAPRSVE